MKEDRANISGTLSPEADASSTLLARGCREDRVNARAATDFRVFFTDGQYLEGEGTVLDISKSGCRVHCPCDLEEGASLELWLFIPNYDWPLRVERAVVRWKDGEQFGLDFLNLRPSQRERLRQFLRQRVSPRHEPRIWQ